MVKIRLTRLGRHKNPFFRLVAVDSRTTRDGSYIELLGTLEPKNGEAKLNKDAIFKWLNSGAQPTDTAKNLLQKQGIWQEFAKTKDKQASERAKRLKESSKAKTPKTETKVKKVKLSASKSISNVEMKAKIAQKNEIAKKLKVARNNARKNAATKKATTGTKTTKKTVAKKTTKTVKKAK